MQSRRQLLALFARPRRPAAQAERLRKTFVPAPRQLHQARLAPRTCLSARLPSQVLQQRRHESTIVPASDTPSESQASSEKNETAKAPREEYQMTFTCKKCDTRSTHHISKQGYHHGTVLVQCPGCKSRHLIADHLKIFSDHSITIEDILAQKGEAIKKAHLDVKLGNGGDVEVVKDKTAS